MGAALQGTGWVRGCRWGPGRRRERKGRWVGLAYRRADLQEGWPTGGLAYGRGQKASACCESDSITLSTSQKNIVV